MTHVLQPFRAEHTGSLIRPKALVDAVRLAEEGRIAPEDLAEIRHAAVSDAVSMQQDIGLRVISDGGFGRAGLRRGILLKLDGVAERHAKSSRTEAAGAEPSLIVVDRLSRNQNLLVDGYRLLASLSSETPKVVLPSPNAVRRAIAGGSLDPGAYRDRDELMEDITSIWRAEIAELARAGCTYVQIDETVAGDLSDRDLESLSRQLEDVVREPPQSVTICCNLALEQQERDAGYERCAEILLNEVSSHAFILDLAAPAANKFSPLLHLPKGKMALLGLVDATTGMLEKDDDLKRQVDQAARYAPIEQLALSANAGFTGDEGSGGPTLDDQKRKLDLIVTTAFDVWGSN